MRRATGDCIKDEGLKVCEHQARTHAIKSRRMPKLMKLSQQGTKESRRMDRLARRAAAEARREEAAGMEEVASAVWEAATVEEAVEEAVTWAVAPVDEAAELQGLEYELEYAMGLGEWVGEACVGMEGVGRVVVGEEASCHVGSGVEVVEECGGSEVLGQFLSELAYETESDGEGW